VGAVCPVHKDCSGWVYDVQAGYMIYIYGWVYDAQAGYMSGGCGEEGYLQPGIPITGSSLTFHCLHSSSIPALKNNMAMAYSLNDMRGTAWSPKAPYE
jgi:hypothetical protein